jgi:hypothetical protein
MRKEHQIKEKQNIIDAQPDKANRAPQEKPDPILEIASKQKERASNAGKDAKYVEGFFQHRYFSFLIRNASAKI